MSGTQRNKTILVDTSLLIEQQKGNANAANTRKALSEYRFRAGSSYSRLEFKRAWLQRAAYLHRLTWEATDIGDVPQLMSSRLASHSEQRRRCQTCLDMFGAFLKCGGGVQLTAREQLIRLRAHLKLVALAGGEALNRCVAHFFDGSRCVRAQEPVRELSDGRLDAAIPECSPKDIRCQVHSFFSERLAQFSNIKTSVGLETEPSKELARISETIAEARGDAAILCDSRKCRRIADALIAVDGADLDVFAANNDREWVVLAASLGKALVNPLRTGASASEERA